MINIPTAEELIKKMTDYWDGGKAQYTSEDVKENLVKFAKLHVEAALKEVTEKLYFRDSDGNCIRSEESNKLVLAVYPLTLIK